MRMKVIIIMFLVGLGMATSLSSGRSDEITQNTGQELEKALEHGDYSKIQHLVSSVNINEPLNNQGDMALHTAIIMPFQNKVPELLIGKHAIVNMYNYKGMTPLHYAAIGGFYQRVELLINSGARVNLISYDGSTALHLAVRSCNSGFGKGASYVDYPKAISILLAHGADPSVKDEQGHTPKDLIKDGLHKQKVIEMLDNALKTK